MILADQINDHNCTNIFQDVFLFTRALVTWLNKAAKDNLFCKDKGLLSTGK